MNIRQLQLQLWPMDALNGAPEIFLFESDGSCDRSVEVTCNNSTTPNIDRSIRFLWAVVGRWPQQNNCSAVLFTRCTSVEWPYEKKM